MSTFGKREQTFEALFVHDEDMKFRALARRNKLLGFWVAELLGKSGAESEIYARSIVLADFEEVGHEDVFRKVRDDLAAGGVTRTDAEIWSAMDEMLAVAVTQLQAEA